ncbi:hypothetical protein PRIPAC_95180 [Pristionchus pacificus]|uniref:Uncharacterized protein n=1 Tax=Pristionchus pacificus TaxID=54126 RepID=A0A2A6B311_PRIPA|nr:hypothetical protein PRIPAC_95180 [Pristionchus pacificus]|eukprot:PDM60265.1 hypothetical protein PRIPAC_54090 [Pristionchus pacificus]
MPRERDRTEEKWRREGRDERKRDSRRHSNKSPERREKRRGRDSRSRSPVHIKEEIHDIGNGYGGFHPRFDWRNEERGYDSSPRERAHYGLRTSGYGSRPTQSYLDEHILPSRPSSYHQPGRTFPKKKTITRGPVSFHHDDDDEVDTKPFPAPTNWLRRTPERDTRPEPMTRVSFLSAPLPLFGSSPLTLEDGSPLPKNSGAPGHLLTAMERAEMEKERQRKKEQGFKKDGLSRRERM